MDSVDASAQQQWNQLVPNNPVPRGVKDRALMTLPRGLRFSVWMDSNGAGSELNLMRKGIVAAKEFQAGVWFGPFEGSAVRPSESGAKKQEMWKIHCGGKLCHYLDGSNDEVANWMRYVRCFKEPRPNVNLLAYQHSGSIYFHSFTAISPGQELKVCLRHFKLEDGLSGLQDQPHICSVCRCMHLSQTVPAMRHIPKVVETKKSAQRAKVAISPDTAATKRQALNSKIDKLRQKLKGGTSKVPSAANTRMFNFGARIDKFASSSTNVYDSSSSCGINETAEQREASSLQSGSSAASLVEESSSSRGDGFAVRQAMPILSHNSQKRTSKYKNAKAYISPGKDRASQRDEDRSIPSDGDGKLVPSLADLLSTPSSLIPERVGMYSEASGSLLQQAAASKKMNNLRSPFLAEGTTDQKVDIEDHKTKPYYGKMVLESSFLKEKAKALTKRVEKLLPNRRFCCIYCRWRFKDLYRFIKHKRRHVRRYHRMKGNIVGKRGQSQDWVLMSTQKNSHPFACSVCGRSFKEIHTMKTHERSHANHTCHYCGRVFGSSTARIVHERGHTGERPYQCDECPKAFRTSYMRTRHKQQCHNTERPYNCEFCNKKFKVRNAMTTHRKTHTHEKNLPCPVCGKNFGLPRDLLRHVKTHTDERPFQCEYCQKSYKQKSTLTTHVQKHFVGDFACQYCPLKFRTMQAHARHESTHTGVKPVFKRVEKPFPCRYCDRVFPRNVKRKVHERVHTGELPFQCEICEKAYSSKKGLESHMRTHSDERPYPCQVCGKSFKERNTLKCHMRIHTGVRPFKCEQCDKTFRVSDALKKHRRSHSDERAYKCQQCEKAFKQLSALRKHERWHLGLRPHICEICGRDFVDRYRLRIHQSIHLEVRPHKCSMCDKSFTEACRLKRHLRDHENLREFECEICGKKFNFKDQLETHVKTHSEERPYQCQSCPKCFKNSSALHRHQRVHSDQSFCCPVCNKCFKFMKSLRKHALQHLDKEMIPFTASSSLVDLCGIIPPDTETSTGHETYASIDQSNSSEDHGKETMPYNSYFTDQDTSSSQSNADMGMYPKSLGMYPSESQATESDQSTIVDEDELPPVQGLEGSIAPESPKGLVRITPLNEVQTERYSEDEYKVGSLQNH